MDSPSRNRVTPYSAPFTSYVVQARGVPVERYAAQLGPIGPESTVRSGPASVLASPVRTKAPNAPRSSPHVIVIGFRESIAQAPAPPSAGRSVPYRAAAPAGYDPGRAGKLPRRREGDRCRGRHPLTGPSPTSSDSTSRSRRSISPSAIPASRSTRKRSTAGRPVIPIATGRQPPSEEPPPGPVRDRTAVIEDPNVMGVRNPKGIRSRLRRARIGEIPRQLKYGARPYGHARIGTDRRFPSPNPRGACGFGNDRPRLTDGLPGCRSGPVCRKHPGTPVA